jgi:hypothetical protein
VLLQDGDHEAAKVAKRGSACPALGAEQASGEPPNAVERRKRGQDADAQQIHQLEAGWS